MPKRKAKTDKPVQEELVKPAAKPWLAVPVVTKSAIPPELIPVVHHGGGGGGGGIQDLPPSMVKEYVPGFKEPNPAEVPGVPLPNQPSQAKTKIFLKPGQWWKVRQANG
ncbi:MAG: hypothetical protein QME51_01740 [Planctomycetota bacterium]|nr:hypothetical protein [Planctomycetota bacterium]